ncbi:aldehyde oxidoreductase [Reichenbachiella sp. 5M10]|uniref:aldo/keto reductase n=1 Tax=Reichenbachiella sp. 5M10 TaxID=1889772 RepID=UPI000C152D02|nr:aldo/keto reductase [Reichenbachiella sp. 5M10]PIB34560.1 aldehyde oxidoreductase [Reichenbachiella sp. 5M10]
MKHYALKNGDQMPALGLGTWKSTPGEVYDAVRTALQIGYRHFDCAFLYDNEKEVGQALKDAITAGEVTRKDLWITSKVWNTHHRTEDVIVALKHTLADLQLAYLDLYLVHWPVAQKKSVLFPSGPEDLISDQDISLEDTWSGMEECFLAGLTKHIGVSNFNQKKIKRVNQSAKIKIEVLQVESHPYLQQQPLLDFCQQHNIIYTAFGPLGSLTTAIKSGDHNVPYLSEHPTLLAIAQSHQASYAQILIAWAIQRGTSVIPKSVNPSRLQENFEASQIELTTEEMKQLSELDCHYRYVDGHLFTFEGSPFTAKKLWDE